MHINLGFIIEYVNTKSQMCTVFMQCSAILCQTYTARLLMYIDIFAFA